MSPKNDTKLKYVTLWRSGCVDAVVLHVGKGNVLSSSMAVEYPCYLLIEHSINVEKGECL